LKKSEITREILRVPLERVRSVRRGEGGPERVSEGWSDERIQEVTPLRIMS
jgi:hypothetical protein